MANVINIEARGEGLEVVITVDFDDGTVKQLVAIVSPPPCESCADMPTRKDVLNMIHTTIGSGGVAR